MAPAYSISGLYIALTWPRRQGRTRRNVVIDEFLIVDKLRKVESKKKTVKDRHAEFMNLL